MTVDENKGVKDVALILAWMTGKWGVGKEKHVWENDREMKCPVLGMLKPKWPWSISEDVCEKLDLASQGLGEVKVNQ